MGFYHTPNKCALHTQTTRVIFLVNLEKWRKDASGELTWWIDLMHIETGGLHLARSMITLDTHMSKCNMVVNLWPVEWNRIRDVGPIIDHVLRILALVIWHKDKAFCTMMHRSVYMYIQLNTQDSNVTSYLISILGQQQVVTVCSVEQENRQQLNRFF